MNYNIIEQNSLKEMIKMDVEDWKDSYDATTLDVVKALMEILKYFIRELK